MRFIKILATTLFALTLATGCSKSTAGSGACDGSATTGGMPAGSASITPACNSGATFSRPGSFATNAMSVSVNGSLCNGAGASGTMYPDEICASVTICTPGCDNQCQTINDVLLDTGSYGLRLFKSVINIPLQQVSNDGGQTAVAECVGFGDGSSEWGPVELADVMLAGEPVARNVPIMAIDSSYSCAPSTCTSADGGFPDTSPQEAGFNGILGVGLFAQDCGDECATDSSNGQYFSCENGVGCSSSTVASSLQVTNPVSMLNQDNNGVILTLPTIPADGQNAVNGTTIASGSIVFGIDTATGNNSSTGKTFLAADDEGNFATTFNGQTLPSFIDSGSSDLGFSAVVSDCSGHNQDQYFGGNGGQFYCPNDTAPYSTPLSFTDVSQTGAGGSPTVSTDFEIVNAFYLLFLSNGGQNYVFSTIGGPTGDQIQGFFDWGLPFFFGKGVAVSIQNTTFASGANTGPGWAY